MATSTVTERAAVPLTRKVSELLGRPVAFLLTALVLLGLFSWTFVLDSDRVAPTRDPAYYTWRTEALMTEPPETLLEVEGALGMFEGGYRVAAPILGGYLRRVADVPTLRMTVYLMVLLPVAIALLLAGFAYRHRRDPLLWHVVALGSGSLLLTPPFVGYLDNVLCLFFLTASLFFLDGARRAWPARIAFGSLLVLGGLTHPTTLAFFGFVLGLVAAARLLHNRFDLAEALREEGPMLATAAGAAAVTFLIWTPGLWGQSASFTESALPPPYASSFFLDRMMQWVGDMGPAINAPLLALGIAGLIAQRAGTGGGKGGIRERLDDDLTKVSLVWLAPLAGLFGFVAGLTYPYYRFFNTTLSWVLFVGLGLYFVLAFLRDRGSVSGRPWLLLLGVVLAGAVVAANFVSGYSSSNWNDADRGWISEQTREDLDALRARLSTVDPDRPVIFAIDDEPARDFQIWGFTKLSGNTSRYGLPPGQIDRGYLYLGDFRNLVELEPTLRGQETYDRVSEAVLDEALAAIEETGEPPIVVVASAFNQQGANEGLAEAITENRGGVDLVTAAEGGPLEGVDFLALSGGAVVPFGGDADLGSSRIGADPTDASSEGGALHLLLVLIGLIALALPGYFAFRFLVPDGGLAEGLGLVPALAAAILSLVALFVLAIVRLPMSGTLAWGCVAAAVGATWFLVRGRTERGAAGSA